MLVIAHREEESRKAPREKFNLLSLKFIETKHKIMETQAECVREAIRTRRERPSEVSLVFMAHTRNGTSNDPESSLSGKLVSCLAHDV